MFDVSQVNNLGCIEKYRIFVGWKDKRIIVLDYFDIILFVFLIILLPVFFFKLYTRHYILHRLKKM